MRQFWPIPIYAFGAFLFNQCALIDALLLSNHHQLCAWTLVSKSYLKINLNVFTHPHILLVIFIVNLISFTLLFTMQQVRKSQFSATLLQLFPLTRQWCKSFFPLTCLWIISTHWMRNVSMEMHWNYDDDY